MNEEISSVVLSDSGDVLAAEDPAASVDTSSETVIYAEVVEERPFLTTSFEDYTVTEGFLLLFLVLALVLFCVKMLKGGFYWL